MKPSLFLAAILALVNPLPAGESALTITYQPLDGLGSGEITVCPVACHDWYSHGGSATAVSLISARNVPPTNNPKEATEDLNLASVCNLHFSTSDLGAQGEPLKLHMDASDFAVARGYDHAREDIICASLECLRRCLPERLRFTPLAFDASAENHDWIGKIVQAFNSHDRTKAFYTSAH